MLLFSETNQMLISQKVKKYSNFIICQILCVIQVTIWLLMLIHDCMTNFCIKLPTLTLGPG